MIDSISSLNIIRIILAFSMLSIATVIDIRKREINDLLWIGFGGVAVLLFFLNGDLWRTFVLFAISMIMAPVVLLIWRLGIFGGADALCLIVLSAIAPMTTLGSLQITPLTTLTNAALVSITPIFINISRNLFAILRGVNIFQGLDVSKLDKMIALCIGFRSRNPKYSFSIERVSGSKKKLDFSFKHAEKTEFTTTSDTWVTPGIPYLIYITVGFVIQIFYGDIIFNIISGMK